MKDITRDRTPLEWKALFESQEFIEEYNYVGNNLGVTYTKQKTTFRVWAPTAKTVGTKIYQTGSEQEEGAAFICTLPMEKGKQGIWSAAVDADLVGKYYTYLVETSEGTKETADVYARACGVNGRRSMVVDLEGTNPSGWKEDTYQWKTSLNPSIYEVHVKDFSHDSSAGIKQEHQGKYLAFTEKDTSLQQDGIHPTCLSYLKTLGISHVHLLPVYDYGSVDESDLEKNQFNWGYDPVNYNVPEGSYATDAFHGETRILQFKQMVQSLHEENIGVIMDVVYNHTYSTESAFQDTVPYYYYRLDETGAFSNGSVCGNDTASEHIMFRKYMIDSVCYWANEYHIDGFRFDLMGLHDVETMNAIRKALDALPNGRDILMYGEPWSGDVSPMQESCIPATKENVRYLDSRIAIFCDNTRDAIKGSVFFEEEAGFVNGESNLEEEIKSCVCAWCEGGHTFSPKGVEQIISYVSAHDNFTLWDKLLYTTSVVPDFRKKDEKVLQMNKMAAGIVMTCLGTPFFQAGEEFGRTKLGIGDSFSSPAELNQLDWKRAYEYEGLIHYYQGLLRLRKGFSLFQTKDHQAVSDITFYASTECNVVLFSMRGKQGSDQWKELFICYNANPYGVIVMLPEGRWTMLSDGKEVFETPMQEKEEKELVLGATTVTILGGRQ